VTIFDPSALEHRIEELNGELSAPGFWDDPKRAAVISAEHARAQRKLDAYRRLDGEIGDLPTLLEMVSEDGGLLAEADTTVSALEDEIALLQEQALFSGSYDGGDAIVTLSAGAGGTDAQDWTEMLLRMYERWAARRHFGFDVLDATPGEEAGLKSAVFRVHGDNAYGVLGAERGVHRLVRLSPFELRAGRRRPRAATRRGARDRRQRPAHRHVPLVGRRRAARQQDRLGRPHHPSADGHRRAVPERALPARQQGHRHARAQEPPARARGGRADGGALA
jgi:hypothetical protein